MRLFIGGHSATIQGEVNNLGGDRCFSVAHSPNRGGTQPIVNCCALLDSGAFSEDITSPRQALDNQLDWEVKASKLWGYNFQAYAIASRDSIIPVWHDSDRYHAQDWQEQVNRTVAAAKFISQQQLGDRMVILGCQGASVEQYKECVLRVLEFAQPQHCIGLGGWRNLGIYKSWLPSFEDFLWEIIPIIGDSPLSRIHIYGVLYLKALGRLQWICDRYGIEVSTDSCTPMVEARNKNRHTHWRDAVQYWLDITTNIHQTQYYQMPQKQQYKQLQLL